MLFQDLPLHQKRGQKHGKPGQAWPGQACQGLAGLPGKRGLEKPSKPGQGQGFEIKITVLFVANSQWNTLNIVCSGATNRL
ncbi:unnamed protein product [Porites evermanni]|uniref:Uncharacterized protein n=1 Tax=Porites evermanni TaxID=104178 RepID=A0ABN8LRN4_9CNID|nr:unnamed protein product [Porites evermanni]